MSRKPWGTACGPNAPNPARSASISWTWRRAMHRSSETIGAIAAALAKAQAELTNPEKSLVATIRGRDPREAERTFRYAPLSSGLEIVRKSLGQHEIATIQTTGIDREVGLIRLTTVLAHSSGEWMSSDWPVCPIGDASAPQRMGAALTYARRYALFTLVGIAGEDDLDAPDLLGVKSSGIAPEASNGGHPVRQSNGQAIFRQEPGRRSAGKSGSNFSKPILAPEASGVCRDSLLAEIDGAVSAEDMAVWAKRALPTKNTLTVEDSALIEKAFAAKLKELAHEQAKTPPPGTSVIRSGGSPPAAEGTGDSVKPDSRVPAPARSDASNTAVLDTGCAQLAFGKIRRKRDKDHRAFVASKPCLVCGRSPTDAHHLRFAQPRALGRKVSDEFTVPLCRIHHRELHLRADERAWWQEHKVEPLGVAQCLWQESRGVPLRESARSPAT